MMLETLGEEEAAKAIDKSVSNCLATRQIKSLAAGKMGMGTKEVGDLVAKGI
jgi:3-isopropylmalate dehydrogenase